MPSEAVGGPANDDQVPPPLPSPERIQELLFDAARLGRDDMIAPLFQASADIAALDPKGYTPLILASYHGHEATTAALLVQGAPVDQQDCVRGNTALMGVAFKGYTQIAALLLDAGANPHVTNWAGQTALMMAALFGHSAIVDLLIDRGSDPHVQDAAGNSAISMAETQSNELMVARLKTRHRVLA